MQAQGEGVQEGGAQIQTRYEYQQEDALKVIKSYKPTRTEEFRSLLRQDYLVQLRTMQKVEGVRDRRKAVIVTPRFLVVGDLVAIDPDHANLIVIGVRIYTHESEVELTKASKMLIRGDQLQYALLVEPEQINEVVEALRP